MKKKYLLCIILGVFLLLTSCGVLSNTNSDEAALDSLEEAGSDISKPHPFDFYLYFSTESLALKVCDALISDGFQIAVREGAIENEWLCLAKISFIPSYEKLVEVQSRLESITEQNGGEYDGWETVVIP